MRTFSQSISLCTLIGVFIIVPSLWLHGQTADKTGVLTAIASPTAADSGAKVQPSTPHRVTLSWTASVPKSASAHDAIIEYKVYRSTSPTPVVRAKADQISCVFVSVTTCIDTNVVSGQTYNYAVTSIAGRADNESDLSKPITVTIK